MIKPFVVGGIATLMLLGTSAMADAPAQNDKKDEPVAHDSRASIPFADLRGQIRNWRAQGRDALLVQGAGGQWYRAEFMSPCTGLPFSEPIGFVLDGTRRVDRFGSIIVRSAGSMTEECRFKSFQAIPDPDEKDEH